MVFFDKLRRSAENAQKSVETQVAANVSTQVMQTIKTRTVLGSIIEYPEAYKLEAYFDTDGINIKIKPRDDVVVLPKKKG